MTFSVMLLVPSWASAGNALLTLNGAWQKVRDDATLRFIMVAVVFYGLSTFEGSFLAIRPVNALSHYTDWTVGHVHAGALGWVAFITFGSIYTLVPSLWKRERMYSPALVEVHFWLAVAGTLIYVFAMWNSGILQGLMWRTYTQEGTLAYSFLDSLVAMYPYYIARAFGGLLFLLGAIVAAFNIWMTVRAVPAAAGEAGRRAGHRACPRRRGDPGGVTSWPNCSIARSSAPPSASSIAIIAAASVGGIVEIAPLFTIDETVEEAPDLRLYTPLELAGRNIYIREGCYACHSQMIRTLRDEVERYGPYSLAVESKYDHPMLWGSKRTGPDLARIGGKYSDFWHVAHLTNPRDVVPESNMPAYRWLARTALETEDLGAASAGAAGARRAVHGRDDRQRRRRCLRAGGARQPVRGGRDPTLRREDPGQRLRRRGHAAHRDGRAGRLPAGARAADRCRLCQHGRAATGAQPDQLTMADRRTVHGHRPRHPRRLRQELGPVLPDRHVASALSSTRSGPRTGRRFDDAKRNILDEDDRPWR